MEKTKKIILSIIYGFVGFNLLQSGYELLIVITGVSINRRWNIEVPLAAFIIIMIVSFAVIVLAIISFFKKGWGLKIAALISKGILILVILVLLFVDYITYIGFWGITLYTVLLFLMDVFIRKVWKYRQIEFYSNTGNIDISKKIVLGVIYGFSIFYLLIAGFEELITFIMYNLRYGFSSFNNGGITKGGFFAATIIMLVAFFAVIVLTTISLFSKNRGVKIAALISQGALFLIALVLNFVDDQLFFMYWYIAFRSLLVFLIDMFVNKIWKSEQDKLKLDELEQNELKAE